MLSDLLLQAPAGTTTTTAPPPGAAPGAPAQQASPWNMVIMMVLIVGVFYFFMIRPQQKKQREEKNFRESLKKGDKVMTIGGIYGKIHTIEEGSLLVEIDTDVKIRVDKTAVRPAPNSVETASK